MRLSLRRWSIIVIGVGWTGSILGLLWLSASAAVGISEYSFRQLMTGPGYLLAEQLRPLSTAQREQRLILLRQHFQYPIELVAADSVELPPQARTMLLHLQAAQNSDEEIAYFSLGDDTLIQFGPMWGSAALTYVLGSPVFLLTAAAASAPIVVFSVAAWRRKQRWCRDLQEITACLTGMARSPAIMLPAVDREWMPLVLAMRRHVEDLSAMNERHKEVSQAVSHELRTPLARMRFAMMLLGRSEDVATRNRLQERLQLDVDRLESLVRASLRFARLTDAPARVAREPIAVLTWLREERMDVDDKGFVINVTAQPEHLQFTADRDLLHLIARNLLENALAHGRSHVIVGARLDETRQMILEVEDDGPGIAAEDRERVFEPFVRLAPGGEESSGFGLGLALVRRAVYLQGGSIGISTSALGGACFRVTLPLPA